VRVCDGAYSEFVMKRIAALGHKAISKVGDGRRLVVCDGWAGLL